MKPYSFEPAKINAFENIYHGEVYNFPVYNRSLEDGFELKPNLIDLSNASGAVLSTGYYAPHAMLKRTIKWTVWDTAARHRSLDTLRDSITALFSQVGKLTVTRTDGLNRWQWFVPQKAEINQDRRKLGLYDISVYGSMYPGWFDTTLNYAYTANNNPITLTSNGTASTRPIIWVENISSGTPLKRWALTHPSNAIVGGIDETLSWNHAVGIAVGQHVYVDCGSFITCISSYDAEQKSVYYPPWPDTQLPFLTTANAQRDLMTIFKGANTISHNITNGGGWYRVKVWWYDYFI